MASKEFSNSYPGSSNYKLVLVCNATASAANNNSPVKCQLYMQVDNAGAGYFNSYNHDSSITIDGAKDTNTKTTFDGRTTGRKLLHTFSKTITHNADGTKSITVKATHNTGVGLGNGSVSGTFVLDNITVSMCKIKVSGTYKNAIPYVKVSGAQKKCTKAFVKVGGLWKATK